MIKLKDIENDVRISEKAKDLLRISLDINTIKSKELLNTLNETLPIKLAKDYSEDTISQLLTLKPEKLLEYILVSNSPEFGANYDKIKTFNKLLESRLKDIVSVCNRTKCHRSSVLAFDSYCYYGKRIADKEAIEFIMNSIFKTSTIEHGTGFKIVKRFGLSKSNIKYVLKDSSKENRSKAFDDEIFMINLLKYVYLDSIKSKINTACKSFDNLYEKRLQSIKSKCITPVLIVNKNAIDTIPKYNIEIAIDIDINEYKNENTINYVATTLLSICNTIFNLGFN